MAAKERKIIFMLTLVLSYFFVEIFVGFLYKSLALVADACHMLSDGLCLVIALIAIQGSDTECESISHLVKHNQNLHRTYIVQ